MSRTVAFAYPGARVQARYGQLLSEGQWERLTRIEDFGSFVQAARETPLRPWVMQLDPHTDPHQIEAQLRTQFRQRVQALADWMPRHWRAALRWLEVLPDLPAAAHVLGGQAPPAWLAADPALAGLLKIATARPSPRGLDAIAGAWERGQALVDAWLVQWRRLWPRMSARERQGLESAVRLLQPMRAPEQAAMVEPLRGELRRLFRRHTRAPAGPLAYLALLWLEMTRIRGALLRRRLGLPIEGALA